MRWTDEMRIETPEQVELGLELAGLGSRFVAQMIDWLWKGLATVVLVLLGAVLLGLAGGGQALQEPSRLFVAAVVSVLYALWLGYGIYFELRCSGQTPGKRFAGIRAIQAGGAPLDVRAACVRNLLAVADFLPVFFLLGAILILLTSRRQRLGDMAAGTVVVRERVVDLGADPAEAVHEFATDRYAFTPAMLAGLTPADRTVLREFILRYGEMDPRSRDRLALRMADTFVRKTGYPLPAELDAGEAVGFLASLLRDFEEHLRHA